MVGKVNMKKADDGKSGNDNLEAQVKQLSDAVVLLMKNQEGMQTGMASITESMKTLSSVSQQQQQQHKETEDQREAREQEERKAAERLGNDELENLDRAGFLAHIMGEINKSLSGLSDGLDKKLSDINDRADTDDTKAELRAVTDKHKDFMDWAPEIQKIIKDSPGLSLSRAYKVARDENPDKMKEVDEKYKDDGNKDTGNKPTGFGGLTPTSGVQTDMPADMTQDDAAEAAWSETMDGIDLEPGN